MHEKLQNANCRSCSLHVTPKSRSSVSATLGSSTNCKVKLLLVTLFLLFVVASGGKHGGRGGRKITKSQMASIKQCLSTSNEVGCDTFACLERTNRCNLSGLRVLCRKIVRRAGAFSRQGKRFIKKSLRCMTTEIKSQFATWGRECGAIEKNIARMQGGCYSNASICRVAVSNHKPIKLMLPPEVVLTDRTSLQLLQSVLSCGDTVASKFRDVVTSIFGRSFLATLRYLQDGVDSPLGVLYGDAPDWDSFGEQLLLSNYAGETRLSR